MTFLGTLIAEIVVMTAGRIEVGPFLFDRLSGTLMVLISLISLIVHRFSVNYMQAERDYKGYFINLGLLTTVLLWFVASANIWLMALSWTGMSIFMYRLLTQPGDAVSQRSARFAMKVFLIGDIAFWAGTFLFLGLAKTDSITQGLLSIASQPGGFWVGLLWMIAGLSKTCNIPFNRWLPVTMASPTPVSAMMHAGFVNAGGILFARFWLLYSQNQPLLMLMFLIGSLTLVYGSLKMMVQTDIKRCLAYSTIGQMGFMITQCGLGAFSIALFHLIAHSLFKSSLFLGSGSVIRDSKEAYLPEPHPNVTDASRRRIPFWTLSLLIIPALMAIVLSQFIGIQGAACLLWIYSILPLLPLSQNLAGHQFGGGLTLLFALAVQLFYAASKIVSHGIFAPDLIDPVIRLTPLHWGVMLVVIVILCYAATGAQRPAGIMHWLYVRLLNQNTVFNHRSKTPFYD